jgi:UDP-N-acetylmuramate: L-alanyl-gamma-D-glutamyl-meso-diaminopimelate ligase
MKIRFISTGGSVMHQLAIALKRKGYDVSGSDDEIFEPAKSNLEREGILPAQTGWFPDQVTADLDAVILGMHARADNPELIRAQELNLPIYSFPEYIFRESRDKTRAVIGGSHGKTTTTSMIMHVLRQCGREFDYLVGARIEGFDQSVNITNAPVIVCEGDEYPASAIERKPKFHFLFPHIAVITGIAWDHINIFPTFENYVEQFRIFIEKIEEGGSLIYNDRDPDLVALIAAMKQDEGSRIHRLSLLPYSIPPHTISGGKTSVNIEGQETELKVFGDHNLMNINAAWLVCRELGLDAASFTKAIAGFTGAARRLELMAEGEDVTVYRDFAHAPSKVKATISAVKQQFPGRKLIALLELHTYSSLNEAFMKEYRGVMDPADEGAVFYSRHALEIKRMPELPVSAVKEGFGTEGMEAFNERSAMEQWLESRSYEGSVVLLMSSGNYDGFDIHAFSQRITAPVN